MHTISCVGTSKLIFRNISSFVKSKLQERIMLTVTLWQSLLSLSGSKPTTNEGWGLGGKMHVYNCPAPKHYSITFPKNAHLSRTIFQYYKYMQLFLKTILCSVIFK